MPDFSMTNLMLGFIASALSVVIAHQGIVWLLNKAGVWAPKAYATTPVPPFGVPVILNSIFWGGLWGVAYAAVHHLLPAGPVWAKGALFGVMIAFVSNSIILPVIKDQPLCYGFDVTKLLCVFLILSGFGAATAIFYRALGGG